MLQDVQHVCLDSLTRSAESLNLLQGFSLRDTSGRNEWSQSVQRIIDSWYFGFGSPVVPGFLESYTQDRNGSPVDTTMHALIRDQFHDLVRIFTSCPLGDVREACENIIEDLSVRLYFFVGFLIGFISEKEAFYHQYPFEPITIVLLHLRRG